MSAAGKTAHRATCNRQRGTRPPGGADLKALETEREAAMAKADADILAVLTPEQKGDWDGAKLYNTTINRYKKVSPTEEQQAKIKAVCKAAAAELAGLKDDDKKAKQARTAVPAKVMFAIEEVILTPEQKAAVAPAPKPATAAPAPAAPAAAEKKPEDASK